MKTLHITNGDALTDKLKELSIKGDILTWSEMLCEGPTVETIDSKEYIDKRKHFFNTFYNLEFDAEKFHLDIEKLDHAEDYEEVVLWFEYDLFCHINMLGVIALLKQKNINLQVHLVCSGKIPRSKNLKALTELTHGQLSKHYRDKVLLTENDLDMAVTLWGIYCGKDHNLIKPFIVKTSNFKYLSNCLKAHLERFPDSKTGLGKMGENILTIVRDNEIKSRHHLLGYVLNYQGYYGYGDLQIKRIMDVLSIFFNETKNRITLNRQGHLALLGHHNFASEIDNNIQYGGVNRFDFVFNKKQNKLVKTPVNAY